MKGEKLLFRAGEVLPDFSQFASGVLPANLSAHKRYSYKQRGEFIRGPIPIAWVTAAAAVSPSAPYFGIIIWHLSRLKGEPVTITYRIVERYGIHPRNAPRILRGLAAAQLITVEQEPGKAPRVRIVRAEAKYDGADASAQAC